MRELLVRYLMGELDGPELRQLEAQLRTSPELRSQLAYLRNCFQAAEDDQDGVAAPPRGLAERTSERVTDYGSDEYFVEESDSHATRRSSHSSAFSTEVDPPTGSLSWSFADFVVAAGVCLAVSMLLIPALSDSREAVLRLRCQENLRNWNVLLALNAQHSDSVYLPVAQLREGDLYVLRIANKNLSSAQEFDKIRRCPGKNKNPKLCPQQSLLQMVSSPTPTLPANPSCSPLKEDNPQLLLDYAIDIGYIDDEGFHSRRNEHSPYAPVMADAPGMNQNGHISPNHPGVIHVLFQDGHVQLARTSTRKGDDKDDLFRNDNGQMKAGCDKEDWVLIPTVQILPSSEEELAP